MQTSGAASLPKVTVMIPTYGQDAVILDAVDSALAQNYPNLEVVVADDASPDQTAAVVAMRQDSRLRYYRNQTNLGRVANYRHALYNLATGDWVINLDGDDFYTDPSFISAAIECAASDDEILIVSARKIVRMRGLDRVQPNLGRRVVPGVEVVRHYGEEIYHMPHLASMYRRDAACACDFYRKDVLSADWESLLRLALRGKVAYLDRTVGVWNLHGANASTAPPAESLIRNLDVWRAILDAVCEAGFDANTVAECSASCYGATAKRELAALSRTARVQDFVRYVRALADHVGWRAAGIYAMDVKHIPRLALGVSQNIHASWKRKWHSLAGELV